jgi:hypothetical protein
MLLVTLLSFLWLTVARLPADAKQSPTVVKQKIPTVDFCEMVKRPKRYFDKRIRITGVYEMGHEEESNINNVRCVRSQDDLIGVRFMRTDERQMKTINHKVNMIMSGKAGVEPRVTVVGILRNESQRWYRYRFDIIRFEDIRDDISQRIVSYDGFLKAGLTYRTTVRHDSNFGLSFSTPLRIPFHHAIHLEWINLKSYPALQRLGENAEQQIIFRVTKDDIRQMEPRRWNRSLEMEILLVE